MVPRSQVRILAPQPSPYRRRGLAADRSRRHGRRARHPHALRRAEAPAPAARAPDGRLGARRGDGRRMRPRWSSSPRPTPRGVRRRAATLRSRCRSGRSEPATPCAPRARRSRHERQGRPRALGRRAAPHGRAPPPSCRVPPRGGRGRDAPVGRSRTTRVSTGASCATRWGASFASSRERTRRPRRRRCERSTPRSTSSIATRCGGRSTGSQPANVQGELYLTDTVGLLAADGRARRRVRRARRRARPTASTRAPSSRPRRRCCATGSTNGTCSRASRSSTPATTWIDPTVEIESDVTIHPFVVLRGSTRIAAGAEIHPHTVADRRRDRQRRHRRPLLLPSPRGHARQGSEGWHVRGDQELAHRRPHEGAAPLVHRGRGRSATTRTSAPARSRRTSRTVRACRRGGRRSVAT